MDKDDRFKIISEGMKNGVTATCKKYNISRTIYYRWLKRFKLEGIDGLNEVKKNFTPKNKTRDEVEKSILNLVKSYPSYGPRSIKYLLEEIGHNISESAVYNIFKRNSLTKRNDRIEFSKLKLSDFKSPPIDMDMIKSGECWIFWITDLGYFKDHGHIYSYNLFDLKSHIACSRLYSKISFNNLEDLLTAVALSVAASLRLKMKYLCLFEDRKILKSADNMSKSKLKKTLEGNGFKSSIQVIKENTNSKEIKSLKTTYTEQLISFLIPLLNSGICFSDIKFRYQGHIRNYNLAYKKKYGDEYYTPVEYHNEHTNTKLVLPLWAYINREY